MDTPLAKIEFDRSGRHLTVYVSGELDQESAPPVTEAITDRIHPTDEVVWLDLAAVSFCGSAALTMFLTLDQHTRRHGARLTLYDPQPQVQRLLEMAGLDELRVWRDPRAARARAV